MRTILWMAVVFFLLCGAAAADLCPKCAGMMYTMDVGACKVCGGGTSSGAHQICRTCSRKLGQCEHCRAALKAAAPAKEEKPAAGRAWTKLFADEKWYQDQPAKEQTFVGTLAAVPQAAEAFRRTKMRSYYYQLGERPVYTGAMRQAALDALIGKRVEMLGKPVDMALEGQAVSEIWPASVRAAADDAATILAAERKKALVDDVENFALTLRYYGEQDKPFYTLTLSVKPIERGHSTPFMLNAVIDKDVAFKVIDWLGTSGVLGRAYDPRLVEEKDREGPCFVIRLDSAKPALTYQLGWELPMLRELLALRALLKDDAAKQMDIFLGRLSGYIKEWTGKPYEPPKDIAAADAKLEQTPDGNFVLYVSNQSFALNPVDVKVTIDGRVAVDESFDQAGGHNWKKFVFALAKGPHELKAESVKGEATLTRKFEVKDKHWAVIDYWHDPRAVGGQDPTKKQLIFRLQDTPIYFM